MPCPNFLDFASVVHMNMWSMRERIGEHPPGSTVKIEGASVSFFMKCGEVEGGSDDLDVAAAIVTSEGRLV